jgi:hypothetical protein
VIDITGLCDASCENAFAFFRGNADWQLSRRFRGSRLRGTTPPYNCPDMKLQVESYSGYKGEQRPLLFRIDDHEYRVEEVLDQWYSPEDTWFKVRANDGNVYILRHNTSTPDGAWDLVSFRKAAG